ncbi:sigma-B regulation protein RsbQ [Bacillus ectoiniformans]|uniref:alpha/beta fold hydrolase n=1 Tax=Bacillus ectoiniformans TaxID=1494429 RepID=UPI0019589956|nr:alpha/beta hydrolase [Bacillus ectoiniformans]MBM7648192.1 sigma-B regulation protein RsbQ [Bacillus ectoiniformans]
MKEVFTRNNVRVIGEGERTIIFAHGFGCDQNMWRFIVPHFVEEFRVVLFDHVGSGKSDLSAYNQEKYKTLHGYAEDLIDILDALDIKKTIFVGHSVSSMIGMLAALQKPEYFEKLVMIGPSPRYLNDIPGYFGGFEQNDVMELLDMMEMNFIGWASFLAPMAMHNPERPHLAQELETSFCSADPAIARKFAEATFFSDHRSDLQKLSTPSLILQCSEDSIVPIEVGEYLHNRLANSTLQLMEAKGHYPHLSHPEETTHYIKEYLSSS